MSESRKSNSVHVVAQQVTNLTRIHEDVGSIPGLLSGLRIRHCCELCGGHRCGLDLVLLWLWCRPAAGALIGHLCCRCGPKKKKKKKEKVREGWLKDRKSKQTRVNRQEEQWRAANVFLQLPLTSPPCQRILSWFSLCKAFTTTNKIQYNIKICFQEKTKTLLSCSKIYFFFLINYGTHFVSFVLLSSRSDCSRNLSFILSVGVDMCPVLCFAYLPNGVFILTVNFKLQQNHLEGWLNPRWSKPRVQSFWFYFWSMWWGPVTGSLANSQEMVMLLVGGGRPFFNISILLLNISSLGPAFSWVWWSLFFLRNVFIVEHCNRSWDVNLSLWALVPFWS